MNYNVYDMFPFNSQRSSHIILCSCVIFILLLQQSLPLTNSHYIQFNHNTFRTNRFHSPTLPQPPVEQLLPHLGSSELSPAEYMVDLSNDLSFRILHYHSILNRNNFAFSPTALMSVLIALYEGAAGRSALELRNILHLPNSRDIIRVGYRDIHRKLRTYFFGSENPLKGLSLNKDNVTITHGYEAVLVFYGYDLGIDMVSSTVSEPSPTTSITNLTNGMEMLKTANISTTESTTSITNVTTKTINTDNVPKEENGIITEKPHTTLSTTTESTTKADKINETTTAQILVSTKMSTTVDDITEAPDISTTTTEEVTTNMNDAQDTTNDNYAAELVAEPQIESNSAPLQKLQKARPINQPSAKLQAPPSSISTPKNNYLPQYARSRGGRPKRHLLGLKAVDSNLFGTLFSPQPQLHRDLYAIPQPITGLFNSEYEVETLDARLFNEANAKSNYGYNTDVISHVFYLGNQELVHTTFKVYNAVLYFKYFDNLKISFLELELDTPNYNLMILLPDYHTDLVSATASLGLAPPLRLMRKQLKPRWVQAIIPDFKLHGIMFLTNDLQNMGVCDIFEPNRADFRPMTDEKGIYVKHIEQSINVSIRTHPINQLKRNYGSQTQPIRISVNHPFLFFVIDRDLDVAVMAGRILNPLNVRIQ